MVQIRKSENERKSDNRFLTLPTYSCTCCRPCWKYGCRKCRLPHAWTMPIIAWCMPWCMLPCMLHWIEDRATVHFWNDFWEFFVKKQVRICTAKVQTRQSNQQLKRAPEPILSEKPPPRTFWVLLGTVAPKNRPGESKNLWSRCPINHWRIYTLQQFIPKI